MVKKKQAKGKVAKNKTEKIRNELVKRRSELEAQTAETDKGEKILGITKDTKGKTIEVKRWHIAEICTSLTCIVGSEEMNEEHKATLKLKFDAVKLALTSKDKDLQDEAIDTMLGDLVAGAYQDKLVIYTRVPSGDSKNSLEALNAMQKFRQSADMHLLNIIKAIRDIKRPPVNVVVKEAEQVNVAEQINQGEQQVNIAKHQANIDKDNRTA